MSNETKETLEKYKQARNINNQAPDYCEYNEAKSKLRRLTK